MKSRAKLFGSCILIFLFLLMSASSTPVSNARWVIETIDAPMYFDHLSNSMLQLFDGKPTMVFGGDHLYLRYWNYVTLDWTIETIDPSPGVGSYASLAKDDYGHTFISYYDSFNKTLKFATPSDNIFLPGWDIETIDATPNSGIGTAIANLSGGQPHISYLVQSGSLFNLYHIQRNCTTESFPFPHLVCNWSTPEQVDASINSAINTSIAVDSLGTPHISYSDSGDTLKHAYRIGAGLGNCGDGNNWQCESVPGTTGKVGITTSIALYNDYPRIAYRDSTTGLYFVYQDAGGWHSSKVRADTIGSWLSLALDDGGIPHLSYAYHPLSAVYSVGSSPSGGTWTSESITGSANAAETAIAFDTSPCILFYDHLSGNLKYTCRSTTWDIPSLVADSGTAGNTSSLALSDEDTPHIAYEGDLLQPATPLHAFWSDSTEGCNDPATRVAWICESIDQETSDWEDVSNPSLAIDPTDGNPAIAYVYDALASSALAYAKFVSTGGNCPGNPAWNCTIIDTIDAMYGFSPSLAFPSTGRPKIAYRTYDGKLKVAAYLPSSPDPCPGSSDWDCEVVDTGLGVSSGRPSLALTSANVPVISYTDDANRLVKLATVVFSGGSGCTGGSYPGSWTCSTIDSYSLSNPVDSSLVLASDSQALISYEPYQLRLATVTIPSGSPVIEIVNNNPFSDSCSLALYSGNPWIAYTAAPSFDGDHSLNIAHRVGPGNGNCGDDSAWQCEVLDSDVSVGLYPSLRINSAGMAYISYFDDTNKDLKLAYTRLFGFLPILQKP